MTIRDTFRDLPVAELEQLAIVRRVMQGISTPQRHQIMRMLGLIQAPESPDAGKPYFDGMKGR